MPGLDGLEKRLNVGGGGWRGIVRIQNAREIGRIGEALHGFLRKEERVERTVEMR